MRRKLVLDGVHRLQFQEVEGRHEGDLAMMRLDVAEAVLRDDRPRLPAPGFQHPASAAVLLAGRWARREILQLEVPPLARRNP